MLLVASLALAACGGDGAAPGPPPGIVELVHTDGVDAWVVELIGEHVARARARPAEAAARASLAMVFEANELWAEGERAWRDALTLEPTNELWRYHLAICARQRGGAEEAAAAALPRGPH